LGFCLRLRLVSKVIMEATGNYSKPLQLFFASNGYKVIELNPILTHKQKFYKEG